MASQTSQRRQYDSPVSQSWSRYPVCFSASTSSLDIGGLKSATYHLDTPVDLTSYHAKYFAHELTKRCASDSVEKLASVLSDAQVDLNPHQLEAALFAFRSPFSKGAILADEVGLGKTIEAGLLLAQKWAERKRRLLVIVPANLRKQWSQELADKFYLPSVILEAKSFNEAIRTGKLNPFDQATVVICSYQFVRSKEPYIQQTSWDLVVIDEAHRLRNVYKTSSKIALAIKQAVATFPKVLLTATPLQNSLLELYGLVSIIDDHAFGDLNSYRARFARLGSDSDFAELKERLKPICKRTLRRQVLEYVKYTNRHALVQEFVPTEEEQRLYDLVSDYLQKPSLYALPSSQRQLMTLILRKLLASSTYAISGTLDGLAKKLEAAETAATAVDTAPQELTTDWENIDELNDEWESENPEDPRNETNRITPEQLTGLRQETVQLREFHQLAKSIVKNSKGEVLLAALRRGFEISAKAQKEKGAATLQQKAVIFTESRRTQDYLYNLLSATEFSGKVMVFNGTNTDASSKMIYQQWLIQHAGTDRISGSPSADMRAALVEHFRDRASILIATEAAAEGINLQFCNLVVNYDLPWNPQRIEQRIGRCHRYGQEFDVVVVNFLNKKNAADKRVYDLLAEKFKLFSGVFGASDEVLGAIESGVDFEKRIASIYQKCRTPEQIQFEFDQLQTELETEISTGQRDAREKLLDNFDQEVVERVRVDSRDILNRFNEQLWRLSKHLLTEFADFDDDGYSFTLHSNPFPGEKIHPGPYRLGKAVEDANTFRVGHPLAQRVIERGKNLSLPSTEVNFRYGGSGKKIAALEPLVGKSGWLTCTQFTVASLETEDLISFSAIADSGETLDEMQCRRFFDLSAKLGSSCQVPPRAVNALIAGQELHRNTLLDETNRRNGQWFETEIEKLDRWAEDRRSSLKAVLSELEDALKDAKKGARLAPTLPEKLERQRAARVLETKREEAWRTYETASREIDQQKDQLLDEVARRMELQIDRKELFTVRWALS
jgi:superfamily II DNA or RNA helicase